MSDQLASILGLERSFQRIADGHLNAQVALLVVLGDHAFVLAQRAIVRLRVGNKPGVVHRRLFGQPATVLPVVQVTPDALCRYAVRGQREFIDFGHRVSPQLGVGGAGGLVDHIPQLDFAAVKGRLANHFHQEAGKRLVEVGLQVVGNLEGSGNRIPVAQVLILVPGADEQRATGEEITIPVVKPFPMTGHFFAGDGVDHPHAGDHHVGRVGVGIVGGAGAQDLAVGQRVNRRRIQALQRQVGLRDDEIDLPGRRVTVGPAVDVGLLQLHGGGVCARLRGSVAAHDLVECVRRGHGRLRLPVVGQGQRGFGYFAARHNDIHRERAALETIRFARHVLNFARVLTGSRQNGIRVHPFQRAFHIIAIAQRALEAPVFRNNVKAPVIVWHLRQIVDIAQPCTAFNRDGTHRTLEFRLGLDEFDGIGYGLITINQAVLLDIHEEVGLEFVTHCFLADCTIFCCRQRNRPHAGLIVILFQEVRSYIQVGILFAGFNIDQNEGMVQLFDVDIVEIVTTVLVLIGQIHDKLHTGLRVDGNRRFGRAVGGGIVRREHHLVHDLVVVRVLGHDGAIRPREGALHFVAVGVGGRALYLHILQAGTVGDEAHIRMVPIEQRVLGRGSDGHRILGDMQGHAGLGYAGFAAVILGEGEADTRRKDVIRAALQGAAVLLHRHGELAAHIGRAGLIARQSRLDVGQEVRHIQVGQVVAEISRGFLDQVGQGRPRRRKNLIHGSGQLPGGGVAAIADGTGGNRDGFRRLGQIRARPARKVIARAGGIRQGDGVALDGVGSGIFHGHAAAAQRVADGVINRRPCGLQGSIARRAGRQPGVERVVELHGILRFPAAEGIALAGGSGKVDPVILDRVSLGVGGVVGAAVQLVGNGILDGLPACVQRHAAFHQVGGQVDAVSLQAGGRAVPAGEVVAGAHGGRGRIRAHQLADVFIRLVVPGLRAIVHHEGQSGPLIPPGVEGYAAGQHIAGELLQHFAGEVGRGIPAAEVVALGRGDHHIHHGFVHPAGGEGVPLHFIGVVGEEVGAPIRGIVGCNGLLPAEVHSDVHVPVSEDGRVLADRLAEVEGIARAIRIVIPARKGQTADRGILRLDKAAVLCRFHHAVEAQVVIVVQAVHLVVRHAVHLDGNIVVRHHEGNGIILEVRDVAQALRVGGEAQVVVAIQQLGSEDDHVAGLDGIHVRGVGGQQRPVTQGVLVDGYFQRPGHTVQRQGNLVLRLAAGDRQAGFNIRATAAAQHHRIRTAIGKGRTVHGQGPAVFLTLHRGKGHVLRSAADEELRIISDACHAQDVGHLAGIAVDSHLHIGGGAGIAVQVGRRKDNGVGELAHFAKAGGGLFPVNPAVHGGAAGGGCLQVERNAAQQLAVIGGVGHVAGELGGRAGDGDACAGLPADDGVQFRVGHAVHLAGFKARQGQGRGAGGQLGLGQHSALKAEGHAVNAAAGVHVDCAEYAVGGIQRLSRIFDGSGHIDVNLHANLGVDGQQQLRRAVMLGVLGREHDFVDFPAVIRSQGNDGAVRPVEISLHRRAPGGGRTVGQHHFLQACAIGNVAAVFGIEDARGDGHGVLLHPQLDVFAPGNGRSVIRLESDGDLHGAGIARTIFHDFAILLGLYGEHIGIAGAAFIRGNAVHGKGLDILNTGKVVHAHSMRAGNGVQRSLHDLIGRNVGRPVGPVGSVADGTRGDHHVRGRLRQVRTGPAKEYMAACHRVAQHNVLAQEGVCGGNGLCQFATDDVAADGVDGQLPCRGQAHVAGGAGGNAGNAVCHLGARRRPAKERVAPAGGLGKDDFAAFNIVEVGIVGAVFAAVEFIGNHIVHGLPSRVQRHAAFGRVRIHVDIAVHGHFRRAEPAEELVELALRRLRDCRQRISNIFRSDMVGLGLLAVVQLVGHHGDFLPAGVEGHAAGQHIMLGSHTLA